jgi:hypothetical protein
MPADRRIEDTEENKAFFRQRVHSSTSFFFIGVNLRHLRTSSMPERTPHPNDPRPEFMIALGLAPPYAIEDVKQAYRNKVKDAHPDHGGSIEAFKAVQEAFERAQAYLEFRADRRGWIAAKMGHYAALQQAIERLERLGAEVTTHSPRWLEQSYGDFAQLTETVTSIRRVGPADGDAIIRTMLANHAVLRELEMLELPKCQLTDDAVLSLAAFQQLKQLDLSHTAITTRALDVIDAIESLRAINREGTTLGWWPKRRALAKLRRRDAD